MISVTQIAVSASPADSSRHTNLRYVYALILDQSSNDMSYLGKRSPP